MTITQVEIQLIGARPKRLDHGIDDGRIGERPIAEDLHSDLRAHQFERT